MQADKYAWARLVAVLTLLGAMVLGAVGPAAAAPAGATTPAAPAALQTRAAVSCGITCAVFRNTGTVGIGMIRNWNATDLSKKYTAILPAGRTSSDWYADTDGLYAGTGYCLKVGRWTGSTYVYDTYNYWSNSPGAYFVGQFKISDYTYVYPVYAVRC